MKTLMVSLLVFALLSSSSPAQSPEEMKIYAGLTAMGPDAVKALDGVLKRPDELSAFILFFAADAAFREKRLEDSGFLFYTAQMRVHFDKECFTAKGTGGNSPFQYYGVLSLDIGSVVNPAVMSEPKVYEKVINRIKGWSPKAAKDYVPGYEFTERKTQEAALEATKAGRTDFIQHMSGISTLLNDPDYFAASKIVRAYNQGPEESRPKVEELDKAMRTMERIEKEKKIEGLASISK